MFQLIDHPVLTDRITRLREASLPPPEFRRLVGQIAALMVSPVTESLASTSCPVTTPLTETTGHRLTAPLILAPILRAGLGLAEGFHNLLPEAAVAHIGIARNEETLAPEAYYFNTPANLAQADVLVLDPMLATGGSAIEAIKQLKAAGATRLRFVCMVACPEGVQAMAEAHPDVPVFTAALDEKLDKNGYIWPGLGDAGDRTFGTA
jgi:uracil phosphoribosyltransferase